MMVDKPKYTFTRNLRDYNYLYVGSDVIGVVGDHVQPRLDALIAEANTAAALAAANRALVEALEKIAAIQFYTIGPSNAHRIVFEAGSTAAAALAAHKANTQTAGDTPLPGTAGGRVDIQQESDNG